jgi:hypothetical protein
MIDTGVDSLGKEDSITDPMMLFLELYAWSKLASVFLEGVIVNRYVNPSSLAEYLLKEYQQTIQPKAKLLGEIIKAAQDSS